MSTSHWQNISAEILDQSMAQTFLMLADCDASPAGESPVSDALSIAVFCDEAQQSAVVGSTTRQLATLVTSRMLELDPSEVSDSDVTDALGEIVNVLAGSLRGVVENPGAMSPPFPMIPRELSGLRCSSQRTYTVEEQPFTLYLV